MLIAHVARVHSGATVLGCQLYFWGRVAYLPLYAFGVPYVRSLVWLASAAGLIIVIASVLG